MPARTWDETLDALTRQIVAAELGEAADSANALIEAIDAVSSQQGVTWVVLRMRTGKLSQMKPRERPRSNRRSKVLVKG